MTNNDSPRVRETKSKIKDAFFELYAAKPIDKISVKEITTLAGYNRGTFYIYYQDIYDLLDKIETDFIEDLIIQSEPVISSVLEKGDFSIELPPFAFYRENAKQLRILLGSNISPHFLSRIKTIAKATFSSRLHIGTDDITAEYIFEYLASAHIGVLTHWLEKDMDLSVEELTGILNKVMLNGLLGIMEEYQKG